MQSANSKRLVRLFFDELEPRRVLATISAVADIEPEVSHDHESSNCGYEYFGQGDLHVQCGSGSEAGAERMQMGSIAKLRKLGIATLNFESAVPRFPAHAIYSSDGDQPLLSWRVSILPYLGEQELYDEFHLDEPWDSPHNLSLLDRMPRVFASPRPAHQLPAPPSARSTTRFQAVVGEGTVFPESHRGTSMQRIHDGASNTILFVEVNADQAVEWTRPQDLQYDPANPVAGLDRVAKPGFPAVFVDNAGYQVPANLDPQNVDRMMTINGGGFVDFSGFAPYLDSDRALNSIATAHLNYESAFQRFAKQAITHPNTGEALLSWRVALLPFLEQQWLYDQFQLDEPWNSPHNIQLLPMIPRVYANPAVAESMTNMLVFQGEDTVFPLDLTDRGRKLSDIEDNASETILTIQSDASCAAEWTRPVDILFDFSNPTICNEAAGTNVVMVDGSRRRLDEDIDETTMRELIVINDDDDAVPPLRDYEWRSFD